MVNDQTHDRIKTLRFTRLEAAGAAVCAVVAFVLLIYCLIAFTPLRNTIPGYPSGPAKKLAVENAIKIDSLESVITRWNLYAENLGRVLAGEATVNFDSLVRVSTGSLLSDKGEEVLREQDSLLRQSVRRSERFGISGGASRTLPVEGMHFFTPVKGAVSAGFDAATHPWIDISAPAGSVVSAVLDGSVISARWDDALGYIIIIQHENNIVSVSEGCIELLRNPGDRVSAGTPIGMTGGSGTGQTGRLHFELWHDGEPLDAARYISF